MENLCKKLMLGGSMAAMLAGITAAAQAQEPATEQVEVSASRIQIQGYEAPTPVTVIGVETLQRDAEIDIGDSIRQLPSVGYSDSPGNGNHAGNASQGDAGVDDINLRNLGTIRTLTLFDGQRVVTSNPNGGGPPAIGGVDLSTLPTSLIERVDVVTGGASAQWGSDAVAGVVNLIVNKTFTGFKANAEYGNSSNNDFEKMHGELTWGTDFLGGRAHTEFAANYTMSPDASYASKHSWFDGTNKSLFSCAVVNGGNPNELCHTPSGTYNNTETNGGLITASVAGNSFVTGPADSLIPTVTTGSKANTAAQNFASNTAFIAGLGGQFAVGTGAAGAGASNLFRGIQFTGPNATMSSFNFGTANITPGTNAVGSACYACSANPNSNVANETPDSVPYHQLNLFNYTSFKLTPDITASVMLNYGLNAEENIANNGRQGTYTVMVDNAFLPASIQQQMIAGSIPALTLGTAAMENLQSVQQLSIANLSQSLAQNFVQNYRQMMRGVFTLKGNYKLFGEDWSWDAYAQNSSVREREWARYNTMNQNFNNAIDSVVVQASGPDSVTAAAAAALKAANVAVPTVGSIACRSSLTSTSWGTELNASGTAEIVQPGGFTPGCVPLDLFGDGTVSQAALNYVAPGRTNPSVADRSLYRIGQSVFSVSTEGTLPWGLAAGKPAVSFGFEDRLEQQRNQRDPLELGLSGVWESGNFSEYAGEYNVQEGFLEVNVPVLKDTFVNDLNVDAAGRITSYSTSGLVETWKLGLTSQINDDIKVRTSVSDDIRAPGIPELFATTLISTQTEPYPPGGPNFNVHEGQPGNPTLVPEQAETVSGGIVLTPHWIENLSMSFDWYSIVLHNGIFAPSFGQITSECASLHVPQYCSLVFFAQGPIGTVAAGEVDGNGLVNSPLLHGVTYSAQNPGDFNFYLQSPVNGNRETTSGLDFQLDYRYELFNGNMGWHILGNYTDEKTRTSLGVTVDGAGAVSNDSTLNPLTGFDEPKLHMTVATTYAEGQWSVTAQARLIGSALLTNNLTQLQSTYTSIDDNNVPAQIYADFRGSYRWNDHINLYAAVDNTFNAPPPDLGTIGGGGTNCIIYDCIGRNYRIGVRFDD